MTIFIRAAKLLMIQCLDKSLAEASAKDLGFFGGLRDIELSAKQKKFTNDLREKISNFVDETTDKDSLSSLKAIISLFDKDVESVRKNRAYERGGLNDTLIKLNSDLERFYLTLENLPFKLLIDMLDNKNPFNILCAHAAIYFAENIFCPSEESVITKTITSAVGASSVKIRGQKEECLLHHLIDCHTQLESVKEANNHDWFRKKLVLTAVDAIKRDNAQICKNSQPVSGAIPLVSLSIMTAKIKSPFKPSRGRLEDCMQHVLDEIDASTNAVADQSASAAAATSAIATRATNTTDAVDEKEETDDHIGDEEQNAAGDETAGAAAAM